MLFSEIIGQKKIIEGLIKLVLKNKLPHALLLLGNEGIGSLPLAIALAQYIQCENKTDNDSCGVCDCCVQMQKLIHPDVHFTFPVVAIKPGAKNICDNHISTFRDFVSKSPYGTRFDWLQFLDVKNKQGNISADECRNIIDRLTLKSYQGGKKVQIIWQPELLGKEGNILLKLIEEPPEGTVLIFVALQEENILPTIASRVQQIRLSPLLPKDISDRLCHDGIAQGKALQIANLAQGNYAQAVQILQSWDSDFLPVIINFLNAVYKNNGVQMLNWVEEVSGIGRESQKQLLQYMQQLFGVAMNLSLAPDYPVSLGEKDLQLVKKLVAMQLSTDTYRKFIDLFSTCNYNIMRNANNKIQLLHLCFQSQYAFQQITF